MKINGSLIFDASSGSEIQNLRIEKVTALPTFAGADAGRLIFNTSNGAVYLGIAGSTNAWVALATGGNASALQTEVDAIESSLGSIVDANGVFNGTAFTAMNADIWGTAPSNLSEALDVLSDFVSSAEFLSQLKDVSIGVATNGQYLKYNGTAWTNDTLTLSDVSDVTATTAEVNKLHGVTASTSELNNLVGTTSAVQSQLDNKQPLDSTLTALSNLTGTGIVVETGTDTFQNRTLVQPGAGLTITNADGVAGNPTFTLANDLAALEGLTTTGYVIRTGDGTATTRAITGTTGRVNVINGSGVASDTSIDLATVTDSGTGAFKKIAVDAYGRVSGTTNVTTSDITALVDSTYVNLTGDTMSGGLVFSNNAEITMPTPTGGFSSPNTVVNKAYVDNLASGISWKEPVDSTGTTNPATAVVGYRFLNLTDNKIYVAVSANTFDSGTAPSANWAVLDKTTDSALTFDSDTSSWVQFSGAGQLNAGIGLKKTGNVIDVNLGAGIAQLPTDEVGIDVVSGQALQLTSTATDGQLTLVLASSSGLEQSSAGLKISASGVQNSMLANSSFTINGDAGTDSLSLGDVLQVKGDSVQGISTSVTESPAGTSTFTITAANAGTTQKGVAKFDTNDFFVNAGAVSIKAGGVDNAQLANSSITFMDLDNNTAAGELGGFVYVSGDTSQGISVTIQNSEEIFISGVNAGYSQRGVASFDSTAFNVLNGHVSLNPIGIDTLSDVALSLPNTGNSLIFNGTTWTNKKIYHVYTSSAEDTSHTVNHGIGTKYCNVTVVDSTDEVVIPQSIHFLNNNSLTVTFNTPINCTIVVMGVGVGAA